MNYTVLMRPVIGAFIGYVTNYIAVKMLFRPTKPIKIGKITLPFTPGVIPKNKERIASAIGETISHHLLTAEELSKALLSAEKKTTLYEKVKEKIEAIPSDVTVKQGILSLVSDKAFDTSSEKIRKMLAKKMVDILVEEKAGEIIAKEIEKVAMEKTQGAMFSMLGIHSLISNLSGEVAGKINEYILQHGEETIVKVLQQEQLKIEEKHVLDTLHQLDQSQVDIAQVIVNVYDKIIQEKLTDILKAVNISQIVTDRINAMDMPELEKLILGIMQKELNALINLGAFIGFILGLVNLLL